MGSHDRSDLTGRLESHQPASLLAIGPRAGALAAAYQGTHPECVVSYLDPDGTLSGEVLLEELAGHGRFDFVILRGVLERLDSGYRRPPVGTPSRCPHQAFLPGAEHERP